MDLKYILIALTVILVAADLYMQVKINKRRNVLITKLSDLLAGQKYEEFDKLMEEDTTKKLIPAFNYLFLKLNKQILQDDEKAVDETFKAFNMRMNNVQKEALYKRGFYYYLSKEDKENTTVYYQLLKDLSVRDMQLLDVMYDTYILNGDKYLDFVKEQVNGAEREEDKMPFYAILADIYHNQGEDKKAEEIEKIVSDYTDKLMSGKKA